MAVNHYIAPSTAKMGRPPRYNPDKPRPSGRANRPNLAGSWSAAIDTGCSVTLPDNNTTHIVSPKCVTCPLPRCIEDGMSIKRGYLAYIILSKEMEAAGVLESEIRHTAGMVRLANHAQCSVRTIYRRVKRIQDAGFLIGESLPVAA